MSLSTTCNIFIHGASGYLALNLAKYAQYATFFGALRSHDGNMFKMADHSLANELQSTKYVYADSKELFDKLSKIKCTKLDVVMYFAPDDNEELLRHFSKNTYTIYVSSMAVTDYELGRLKSNPYIETKLRMEKIVLENKGYVIRSGFFVNDLRYNPLNIYSGLQMETWYKMFKEEKLSEKQYSVTNVSGLCNELSGCVLTKPTGVIKYCTSEVYKRSELQKAMHSTEHYVPECEVVYTDNEKTNIPEPLKVGNFMRSIKSFFEKNEHMYGEYFK